MHSVEKECWSGQELLTLPPPSSPLKDLEVENIGVWGGEDSCSSLGKGEPSVKVLGDRQVIGTLSHQQSGYLLSWKQSTSKAGRCLLWELRLFCSFCNEATPAMGSGFSSFSLGVGLGAEPMACR